MPLEVAHTTEAAPNGPLAPVLERVSVTLPTGSSTEAEGLTPENCTEPGTAGMSSSTMPMTPRPAPNVAPFVGAESWIEKYSVLSATLSLMMATVKVLIVSAGAKVSVPEVAVKSAPDTAVPLTVV